MSELADPDFVFVYYHFTPSLPAAILFMLLFAVSLAHHVYVLGRTRTWYFLALVVGIVFEVIAYAGRIVSHYKPEGMVPYIVQATAMLVAPALFAASIYMILGRLIRLLRAESYSLVPLRWLTKVFVTGDIISFLMQGGGSGLLAAGAENVDMGEKIVIGGIFVQVLIFGFFLVVALVFHWRIHRAPTREASELNTVRPMRFNWQTLLYVIYGSGFLIMVRSVFRAVEYIEGWNGYLRQKEVFIYVMDGLLMIGAVVLFNWCHPSAIVPGRRKKLANDDTSMEELGMDTRG